MAVAPAAHLLGSGLVTCLGAGLAAQVPALRSGCAPAARAPAGPGAHAWPYQAIAALTGHERLHHMLEQAVAQALDESGLDAPQRARMAILVGSTCLDLPLHEDAYAQDLARGGSAAAILGPDYGNVAAWLAERFAVAGPQYTLNTACSSSANALLHARLLLNAGIVEHALVIGVEAFNRLSVQGFASLMLLSRQGYRPFDRGRDGLILGEGAGAMVLGRAPRAGGVALRGAASACDPSSPTNSLPERVVEVMRAALNDAGVGVEELLAIKAHGTGTPSNDQSEGQGMLRLGPRLPPFTSVKPYIGHTLGGCGVMEILLLLAAWREGFLPATPGFAELDPGVGLAPVAAATPIAPRGAVLCNFFGFGGNNTSLVVARE